MRRVLATAGAIVLAAAILTPSASATGGTYTGSLYGAPYRVRVPANWNGTLVLYSHGYRQAVGGATTAQDAPTEDVATALLAKGFAIAGSSYGRNGWAVTNGLAAGVSLLTWFDSHVGVPSRVYAWGDSLGGLVTQTLAERYPALVDGALPMCGVLGGSVRNLDLALDVAVAVKRLLYPSMKLSGYASYDEAKATFDAAFAAVYAATQPVDGSPNPDIAKLLAIASIVDAPYRTASYDGTDAASVVGGIVEGLATALFYGTVDRYELEQRVGGNPSTNAGVDYTRRIGFTDGKRFTSFGFGVDLLKSYAGSVNVFGARVTANADARRRFATQYVPTGDLRVRTLTMHTAYDPLVLVQNESVFRDAVAAHNDLSRLVQLYTTPPASYDPAPYGAGHCNFTTAEYVGALKALDSWVRTGATPTAAGVKASTGDPGFSTTFTPPPWPLS